jgi:hypothetical protein
MKNKSKKLVGGFIVALLIATIGAIIVSAETKDISEDETSNKFFWGFGGVRDREISKGNLFYELTDEQEEEILQLKQTMIDENATCEEIQEAVMQKLDEWGILDNRLDNAIEQTELRLEILNRQKELRAQGYSWEEINDIIQDEYDLGSFTGYGPGMDFGLGFHKGRCRSFR